MRYRRSGEEEKRRELSRVYAADEYSELMAQEWKVGKRLLTATVFPRIELFGTILELD
jgi:hypothetical protein